MDKRNRAILFRTRLSQALEARGQTQSGLARAVGVDRSTVSQLLNEETTRLPNAHVVAECASVLGVSGDWLLGLSDLREQAADVLAGSMQVSQAERSHFDEQIFAWQREAAGYKIRHVPATLPDMLKTEAMLRWEYAPYLGRTTDQAIGASRDRLDLLREEMSDFEIAMPLFTVDSFATATGYYRGLPDEVRRGQIDYMLELHAQLYPSLRVHLFDARRLWSSGLTVFGPLIGVVYLGQHNLVFRDRERVRNLADHFDGLVREASVSARDWPRHIQALSASSP
ncbi:MAG: helix-turn-helix domain-containing protein [Silicimonas sp.]|jgi:transcriptional regulator with XRE-family HTH domain|nr:helix-turn-helix domain-containing protein [Silicimonas sp.]